MTEFQRGLLINILFHLFVYPLFVALLWNCLMPKLFGLPEINYLHGLGLILLSDILFSQGYAVYFDEIIRRLK